VWSALTCQRFVKRRLVAAALLCELKGMVATSRDLRKRRQVAALRIKWATGISPLRGGAVARSDPGAKTFREKEDEPFSVCSDQNSSGINDMGISLSIASSGLLNRSVFKQPDIAQPAWAYPIDHKA
jgi:hypothetical protein